MRAIKKGVTVVFKYNNEILTRKVFKKSGRHMLVNVPVSYLGGEVHQSQCYVPCASVIEVI